MIRTDIEKMDPEIVDHALSEGIRYMESQAAHIDSTQRKVITILGWIIAALISLLSFLFAQISAGTRDGVAF